MPGQKAPGWCLVFGMSPKGGLQSHAGEHAYSGCGARKESRRRGRKSRPFSGGGSGSGPRVLPPCCGSALHQSCSPLPPREGTQAGLWCTGDTALPPTWPDPRVREAGSAAGPPGGRALGRSWLRSQNAGPPCQVPVGLWALMRLPSHPVAAGRSVGAPLGRKKWHAWSGN